MPSQYDEELNTAERAAREAGRSFKNCSRQFDVTRKVKISGTTADLEAIVKSAKSFQGRFPETAGFLKKTATILAD